MGQKVKVFGYPEFSSISSAILQLIKDENSTKEIKDKIPNCKDQHIYYVKKMLTSKLPLTILEEI